MTKNTIITVTAEIRAKDGCEEQLKHELISLLTPTRSEPGCIMYDLYQSPDIKSCFMFYESWKSKKDLEEHLQKPHIKMFIKKAGELFAEPMRVSVWEKIV
jgi:quinol monooxygenase YgiN